MKYILFLFPFLLLAQKPIIEYYDNGNVFREYFLKDQTQDSTFVQYYKNGNIQSKTQYKKCEYETNYYKIYRFGCGVGKYFNEEQKILKGRSHGKWSFYYKDGSLKSISNYHCGFEQGNFIDYRPNGSVEYSDFYHEGNVMSEREYHKNGALKILTQYTYLYDETIDDGRYVVSCVQTEFREDSTVKSVKEISDYDMDETAIHKEYYPNGFLKFTEELVDDFREGVYREFYENGHKKYEGEYIDEERVKKHYYYDRTGKMTKIETWDANKMIHTEYKN